MNPRGNGHPPSSGLLTGCLAGALAAFLVVLSGGCGASRSPTPGAGGSTSPATTAHKAPIWMQTLQMVSPAAGWALGSTSSPYSPTAAPMVLYRTTDGGRTWAVVTPPAAKALLTPLNSSAVLSASTASRAWLAVTRAKSQSNGNTPNKTRVFATADGGRTWSASAVIRAPGNARWLTFTDPEHGWLMQDLGEAMEQSHVQVYRTSDGGLRWTLVAQTLPWPKTGTSRSGLPVYCDKAGVSFATPQVGWITGACNSLARALLVSRDGGRHWAPQPVPIAADTCQYSGCEITPPHFSGATGYLVVGSYPARGILLVSHNYGATWQALPVPPGSRSYPQVTFFNATHGMLVPTGPQGSIGRVFYATADGGLTWRPIAQGAPAWQPGPTIEFVSPTSAFAWNLNERSPVIYATANAGRKWTSYVPLG